MNKRKFGIIGEKIAQGYLINEGYKILETNFYTKRGEIDIICKKDDLIVFVEVKTRSNYNYGTPAMSVTKEKRKHIKTASKIYIHTNILYNYNIRFDIIEILIKDGKCKINHLKQIM